MSGSGLNNKYNWVFYAEWISTFVLIIGVVLTSYNIYPMNIYWSLAGNIGWGLVAYSWRKWSLLIIQFILSVIYCAGIYSQWK